MANIDVVDGIARALGLHLKGQPVRVTGGADFATFRVECRLHGALALRVTDAWRAPLLEIEEAAMDAARMAGVPVPTVIARGAAFDHAAMAVAWVSGVPIGERIWTAPAEAKPLGRAFGEVQARIHQADPGRLATVRPLKPDSAQEADLLQRALGGQDGVRTLLHLDYHPLNVLTDEGRITGVIDWTNAACGDARLDVARTYGILRIESPSAMRRTMRSFIRGWLSGYRAVASLKGDLAPFLAWAGLFMEEDLAGRGDLQKIRRIHVWANGWDRHAGPGPV